MRPANLCRSLSPRSVRLFARCALANQQCHAAATTSNVNTCVPLPCLSIECYLSI